MQTELFKKLMRQEQKQPEKLRNSKGGKDLVIAVVRHIRSMLPGYCDVCPYNVLYLACMVFLVYGASKKLSDRHNWVVELINDENLAYASQNQLFVDRGITAWIRTALKTFWKDSNVMFFVERLLRRKYRRFPPPEDITFWPTLPEDRAPNKAFK